MNKYACQMEINLMLTAKAILKFEGVKMCIVMAHLGVLEAHYKC